MTLKEAQAAKPAGITIRRTGYGRELRVAFKGRGQEASAYYTDDAADALATARCMVGGWVPVIIWQQP